MYNNYKYVNSRFIPFAGPFLLGALTGGVAVSALGPKNYPMYQYPTGYYPSNVYYPYY